MCCCCFPSSALVWLTTGSHLIGELTPGHELVTINLGQNGTKMGMEKSPFLTYLHIEPEMRAEFIQLRCEDGSQLDISPEHLLFKSVNGRAKPVPAKSIEIGESLFRISLQPQEKGIYRSKVLEIKSCVTMSGVYAPLTQSGTLIVNGFFVSCYSHVKSHQTAHRAMGLLRFWKQKRTSGKKRNLRSSECHPSFLNSRKEDNRTVGIHPYAQLLMGIRKLLPNKI